ncbi:MAG: FlgO family outer membrane protein [Hydrogenophilus sp.]|nr:FlgO family outer membrane protein [Hydrogenophilus sp.]
MFVDTLRLYFFSFCALLAVFLGGCATSAPPPPSTDNPRQVLETAQALADSLASRAPEWVKSGPVLVSTLVDVDQLEHSTTLGRALSEQIGSRLVAKGFTVTEVKLRTSLFVKKATGELMLARELTEIAEQQAARAVVVGTYAAGKRAVHINVKLVDPVTGTILAADDAILSMDGHVRSLLR